MIRINRKKAGAHVTDPDQPLPLRAVNGRLDQLSLATIAQEIVLTLLDLRRLQITPSILEAMLRDFDGIAKVAKIGFEATVKAVAVTPVHTSRVTGKAASDVCSTGGKARHER
jgi:hypothetical protein